MRDQAAVLDALDIDLRWAGLPCIGPPELSTPNIGGGGFDFWGIGYRQRTLRVLDKAGGRIDLIGTGGDIGEQQRMLLDPAVWRRRIKPYSGRPIATSKELGYSVAPTHQVQGDTPPENVVAIFEAARRYRWS